MPSAEWLGYQRANFPVWRRLLWLVALLTLMFAPVSFYFDLQMLRLAQVPELQVRLLQAIHAYQTLLGLVVLLYLLATRSRREPTRLDLTLFGVATAQMVVLPALIAVANQLSHGSITIFAMGVLFALFVSFERPRTMIAVVLASAGMILVAVLLLQGDLAARNAALINTLVIGIGAAFLYPFIDRFRFDDHRRRQQLESLLGYKDTLMRALGHDLRTPLNEVRRAALALEGDPDRLLGERHRLADDLRALTRRFGMVLTNLLAIDAQSRLGGADRDPASLLEVVQQVTELSRWAAERKQIELHVDFEDDLLIAADRESLVTVLDNLVNNAIKFTPPGGSVRIDVSVEAATCSVCVSDTGVGISPTRLERLQAGESLAPTLGTDGEQGVGIGLSVARNLLAVFAATLSIEARGEAGVRLCVHLPRYFGRSS